MQVVRQGDRFTVGDWTISCNLSDKGESAIHVTDKTGKASVSYDAGKQEGRTQVTDFVKGKQVEKTLADYLPDFEI